MRKKTFFLVIIFVLAVAASALLLMKGANKNSLYSQSLPMEQNNDVVRKEIWVGANKLMVEIASTTEARAKGLGGRNNLGEEAGMLFLFGEPDYQGFWMKDMRFPLDFIWIQGDKIIDITSNVPAPANPSDLLPIYQPAEKADKVLEVNAGWVARHEVKIGDTVK